MSELEFNCEVNAHRRYNPLTGERVLVCPQRMERPWKGQEEKDEDEESDASTSNYLSPGGVRTNGMINDNYESTFVFDNDYPALTPDNASYPEKDTIEFASMEDELFKFESAAGECKVLCFHPNGHMRMALMSEESIRGVNDKIAQLLMSLLRKWLYVQIFENKGSIMGCSNPHPHCQLWSSSFIPDLVERKDIKQREFFAKYNKILLMEYLEKELEKKERIVIETDNWVWLVPFWAVWPYETMLIPKRKCSHFLDMNEEEKIDLAVIMKRLTTCYDNLFHVSFPYSMGWHGSPNPTENYPHWQLHACYLPPLIRSKTVKKFMVGYELMAMPQRDFTPEKAAATLRDVSEKHYLQTHDDDHGVLSFSVGLCKQAL